MEPRPDMENFAKWVESLEIGGQKYPILAPITPGKPLGWDIPEWYWAKKTVQVEPFYSAMRKIGDVIYALGDGEMFAEAVSNLYEAYWPIHDRAYETIANPEYDAERSAQYRTDHPEKFTITIGQSYNPEVVPGVYAEAAYSTAFDAIPVIGKNETPDQG